MKSFLFALAIFMYVWLGGMLTSWAQTDSFPPKIVAIELDSVPEIEGFVFAEKEPTPLNMQEVQQLIGYPQEARDRGIQGTVLTRVLVNAEGTPESYRLLSDTIPILTAQVEAHVMKLRFSPAEVKGEPIAFWVNIPFNFRLINNTNKPSPYPLEPTNLPIAKMALDAEAWGQAQTQFDAMLGKDQNYLPAYLGLSLTFTKQGKTGLARKYLKQAQKKRLKLYQKMSPTQWKAFTQSWQMGVCESLALNQYEISGEAAWMDAWAKELEWYCK